MKKSTPLLEISSIKKFYEERKGKKFAIDEFVTIFDIAFKENPNLVKQIHEYEFEGARIELTLDNATEKWEGEISTIEKQQGSTNILEILISEMRMVIDYYANEENANWEIVGTLANIHENLGLQLYENYQDHLGYSRSVVEGLERHSTASRELLEEISRKITDLKRKSQFADLRRWRKFLSALLEGFQEILPKLKSKAALQKDEKFYHHSMMAGYYEIQEKKLWGTISDFNSSSDSGLRKAAELMEKERQKMSSRAEFHLREKKEIFKPKIHGNWNDTIPTEEEAGIYGENFLKENPENSSSKKKLSKQEQKKFNKT